MQIGLNVTILKNFGLGIIALLLICFFLAKGNEVKREVSCQRDLDICRVTTMNLSYKLMMKKPEVEKFFNPSTVSGYKCVRNDEYIRRNNSTEVKVRYKLLLIIGGKYAKQTVYIDDFSTDFSCGKYGVGIMQNLKELPLNGLESVYKN